MIRLAVFALATFALVGCKHAPQSAARKYASAPRIENPLAMPPTGLVPGLSNDADALSFASFDGQRLCFEGENTQSPAEATATRYSLRFLNTDDADLKNAPSLKTSTVTVLASRSELVPETRTVQDTVRDSHGNTVATVSRQVQELVPHYQTQLRVCLGGAPQALTPDARFMVLVKEAGNTSAWGIPLRPRTYWVWRFPAADGGTPVALR